MRMKDNLINFLYDKNYFISIYENYIYVFNYLELISLSDQNITLKLENFQLEITGSNLFITKMLPNEILIKGNFQKVGFNYE